METVARLGAQRSERRQAEAAEPSLLGRHRREPARAAVHAEGPDLDLKRMLAGRRMAGGSVSTRAGCEHSRCGYSGCEREPLVLTHVGRAHAGDPRHEHFDHQAWQAEPRAEGALVQPQQRLCSTHRAACVAVGATVSTESCEGR